MLDNMLSLLLACMQIVFTMPWNPTTEFAHPFARISASTSKNVVSVKAVKV